MSDTPNPFGGFSITMVDEPADAAAVPAPGGPSTAESGAGRVDSKLVIIGSGPAGLTAAIYAARANLEPIVIAGSAPGGQLMMTSDVENYPGFPDGVQGPEMMELFRAQAARFGTTYLAGDATAVDLSSRPFKIRVDEREIGASAL